MGLRKRAKASHCPEQQKEAILNEKEKLGGGGGINAYIQNSAAIGCLTSLLFVSVNSPCSPVSLKYSIPIHTEKCSEPLTLIWWVYLKHC